MNPSPQEQPILVVDRLVTEFRIRGRWWPAVRDVSFSLARNETLALVGESGCGKSVTALSIMGLVPSPQGRIASGRILVDGRDLVGLPEHELEHVRGDRVAMVFQEPMSSLNPVLTIGFQVAESLRYHRGLSGRDADTAALALLDEVKIPSARQRFNDYPHQFSGGMRQRVMIAMALACQPDVLLADEPTTALDVTIQAQVLALLDELKRAHGMAVLFITHNLGVVANIADRVAVMYAGEIVELASAEAIFDRPTHPYTEALFSAIPRVDRAVDTLHAIPGQVPPVDRMPRGCRFAPRCALREPRCTASDPVLAPIAGESAHWARCTVRAPAIDVVA
ncbi:MAG: ABC transporter ATP-binding protein [Alphaproteobacteria bacterium]|nr:ABC transporter ATP-binding protein [Alphaproteobacteria bacterium]